jgi:hypothetical protein
MVARLSALRAGRFLPQEDSWYSFMLEADEVTIKYRKLHIEKLSNLLA